MHPHGPKSRATCKRHVNPTTSTSELQCKSAILSEMEGIQMGCRGPRTVKTYEARSVMAMEPHAPTWTKPTAQKRRATCKRHTNPTATSKNEGVAVQTRKSFGQGKNFKRDAEEPREMETYEASEISNVSKGWQCQIRSYCKLDNGKRSIVATTTTTRSMDVQTWGGKLHLGKEGERERCSSGRQVEARGAEIRLHKVYMVPTNTRNWERKKPTVTKARHVQYGN